LHSGVRPQSTCAQVFKGVFASLSMRVIALFERLADSCIVSHGVMVLEVLYKTGRAVFTPMIAAGNALSMGSTAIQCIRPPSAGRFSR